MSQLGPLLEELKRRRVFRALVGWGIFSFAVLQVVEPLMHALDLPEWTLKLVVALLGLGFPATVVLAWIFDIGKGGIERTPPNPPPEASSPGRHLRGARLALVLFLLGALAATPGLAYYFLWHARRAGAEAPAADRVAESTAPSIAVLPFVDMSVKHDQEYFADGVAEEILNALAQVEGLKVVGRTSSFSFKGKQEDIRSIGKALGAGAVLEGSVRKEGGRIRVTAQMVKAADGYHLWSQTFDRDASAIFAVQDEIAQAVVSALKGRILPAAAKVRSNPAVSPEAYDHFLKGRQAFRTGTSTGTRLAVAEFEKAIGVDPSYASAWAGLAEAAVTFWGLSDDAVPEFARRAVAASGRALALAPDLADSYRARGLVRQEYDWDWAGARADFEKALALGPADPGAMAQLAFLLANLGLFADAAAHARRATELDPLSPIAWQALGYSLNCAGDLDGGRRALGRALALSEDSPISSVLMVQNRLLAGHPEEALPLASRTKEGWARLTGTALSAHALGRDAEANAALGDLEARYGNVAAYQVAQVLGWRGDLDGAFRWLERAHAQRDPGLGFLKVDPTLRKLHGDPRWAPLLEKMNFPVE
ncbi:MAG TPA: hypothetical protein VMT17_06145 [Anaeromyxobacteraceae bacterium]|nr:hypothetical protein [Anaeromyxobacteraceae bacterium]